MLNLLGSALIGGVGSLLSSNSQKKTINKQVEAQKYATDRSIALQRDALAQTQSNLAPYLSAGYGALSQLQSQFNLGNGAKPSGGAAGTSPTQGGPDYAAYLANNPDIAAEAARVVSTSPSSIGDMNGDGTIDATDYGQYHAQTFADRPVPTLAAAPQQAEEQTFGPQFDPRPAYSRPDQPMAPSMPDLSAAAYQKSPGFEAGLASGQRNLNANFAARGLLGSGAGAEAAIKFGTDYQNQDYNNWRNQQLAQYQTQLQQFNMDRANTNANFSSDRAFGTGAYESDRGYDTSRFDQQVGNLFNLVNAGNPSQANAGIMNSANNIGGLLQTGANNLSSLYGQQAQNAGGLAGNLTGIGQGLLGNMGGLGGLFGGSGGGGGSSNPLLNWSQSWGGGS